MTAKITVTALGSLECSHCARELPRDPHPLAFRDALYCSMNCMRDGRGFAGAPSRRARIARWLSRLWFGGGQ